MHFPAPSPPLRGGLLRLVARLCAASNLIRDLVLGKMRKDAGIAALPDETAKP